MTAQTARLSRPLNRYLMVGIPLAALAFLANPHGPLGGFWAPAAGFPQPPAALLPLFILLNVAEAVTFGGGIAFLLFGSERINGISPTSPLLTRAAHLSIAWLLISWFPHDSLHMHLGEGNLGQIIAVEYAFHGTLMIAGGILALFFTRLIRK